MHCFSPGMTKGGIMKQSFFFSLFLPRSHSDPKVRDPVLKPSLMTYLLSGYLKKRRLCSKSLPNLSDNYVIGPIKETTKKSLPLILFLDHQGYTRVSRVFPVPSLICCMPHSEVTCVCRPQVGQAWIRVFYYRSKRTLLGFDPNTLPVVNSHLSFWLRSERWLDVMLLVAPRCAFACRNWHAFTRQASRLARLGWTCDLGWALTNTLFCKQMLLWEHLDSFNFSWFLQAERWEQERNCVQFLLVLFTSKTWLFGKKGDEWWGKGRRGAVVGGGRLSKTGIFSGKYVLFEGQEHLVFFNQASV